VDALKFGVMKNLSLIAAAILVLLLSCHKEENEYDEKGRGKGFAIKNDKNWYTSTYANNYRPSNNTVTVALSVLNSEGVLREALRFKNLELYEGERSIGEMHDGLLLTNFGIFYSTILADGDVTGDVYYSPPANLANTLTVESYNEATGELHCRFNAFIVGKPNDPTLPDTLRFEDGWFRVKVIK